MADEKPQDELARLRRINAALMRRVEKMTDAGGDAFGLFENSLMLEKQVRERTAALQRIREELEQSNLRLREAKQIAEESAQTKTRFLATMSHEIRTPLNGILGMLQLVLGRELPADLRGDLDVVGQSADALRSLLDDILDFSKLDAGQHEIVTRDFDLHDLCEGVGSLFVHTAQSKGVALCCEIDPSLARAYHGGDGALRQVLCNLVGNAVKFTAEGSVQLSVGREGGDSRRLVFCVADSGIGIAAEQLQRIFDPFAQIQAGSDREFGGTGLGLAICQRLVDLLGGSLEVTSEPGAGSCFCFALELPEVETPVVRSSAAAEAQGPRRGLRVLVAEDNRVNQLVTRRSLEKLGCAVDVVADGHGALRRVREASEHYDLVLMDMQMPGMDGLEATRQIRALGDMASLPIIALTANAFDSDREACLAAGMDDYMTKPVSIKTLGVTLVRWTDSPR